MLNRERIIIELWKRIGDTEDIVHTARNPSVRPSVDNMPLANIFDFAAKASSSGGSKTRAPIVLFDFQIIVELFVAGTTEESASTDLLTVYESMLASIFTDGASLNGLCSIEVREVSQVFKPPIGGNVAGIGTVFSVRFTEDFNNLT